MQLNRLKDLCLGYNLIGNDGAAALAQTITKLPQLETLDLNRNLISDHYAIMLVEKLPKMMKSVLLSNNQLSEAGISSILEILKDQVLSW